MPTIEDNDIVENNLPKADIDDPLKILADWGFVPFPVGQIHTPLPKENIGEVNLEYHRVRVSVPGRLNALIKRHTNLILREPTGEFNYGEVSFGVNLGTYARVSVHEHTGLTISENTKRPSIVRHFSEIMLKTLGYSGGLYVEANNDFPYSHIGSGSSAALATATALAINRLFGEPIQLESLPLFLAQNYGEEMQDAEGILVPVQCTGGTTWMALVGGLIVVDNSQLVQRMDIAENLTYVIGLPNYPKPDAKGATAREIVGVFQLILDSDAHLKPLFDRLFQEIEDAVEGQDIERVGQAINEAYSDEIKMHGFDRMFPGIREQFWALRSSLQVYAPIAVFISSVGPSIVTICRKENEARVCRCYRDAEITDLLSPEPANSGAIFEELIR